MSAPELLGALRTSFVARAAVAKLANATVMRMPLGVEGIERSLVQGAGRRRLRS